VEHKSLGFVISLKNRQLMAQCQDLGLQSSLAPKPGEKGIEHH
jgi:hypothetical protein